MKVILTPEQTISAIVFKRDDLFIDGTVSPSEEYSGDYEIQSLLDKDVIARTKNKYLRDDITVKKVGYSETSNESGGSTIYIGDI